LKGCVERITIWTIREVPRRITGSPIKGLVSTSYVEKHNQTMRQHMKRFARLTAAHGKKLENHVHMVALYTCWYNFAGLTAPSVCRPLLPQGLKPAFGHWRNREAD
jgi:hypothetical protein